MPVQTSTLHSWCAVQASTASTDTLLESATGVRWAEIRHLHTQNKWVVAVRAALRASALLHARSRCALQAALHFRAGSWGTRKVFRTAAESINKTAEQLPRNKLMVPGTEVSTIQKIKL